MSGLHSSAKQHASDERIASTDPFFRGPETACLLAKLLLDQRFLSLNMLAVIGVDVSAFGRCVVLHKRILGAHLFI